MIIITIVLIIYLISVGALVYAYLVAPVVQKFDDLYPALESQIEENSLKISQSEK